MFNRAELQALIAEGEQKAASRPRKKGKQLEEGLSDALAVVAERAQRPRRSERILSGGGAAAPLAEPPAARRGARRDDDDAEGGEGAADASGGAGGRYGAAHAHVAPEAAETPAWVNAHAHAPAALLSPAPARASGGEGRVFKRRRLGASSPLAAAPPPDALDPPPAASPLPSAPSPHDAAAAAAPAAPSPAAASPPSSVDDDVLPPGLFTAERRAPAATPAALPPPLPLSAGAEASCARGDAPLTSLQAPSPPVTGQTLAGCTAGRSLPPPPSPDAPADVAPADVAPPPSEPDASLQRAPSAAAAAAMAQLFAAPQPPPAAAPRAGDGTPKRGRRSSGGGRRSGGASGGGPGRASVPFALPPPAPLPDALAAVLSQPWPSASLAAPHHAMLHAAAATPAGAPTHRSGWTGAARPAAAAPAALTLPPAVTSWRHRGKPSSKPRGSIEHFLISPPPRSRVASDVARRRASAAAGAPVQPPPVHPLAATVSALAAAGRTLELQPSRGAVVAAAAAAAAASAAAAVPAPPRPRNGRVRGDADDRLAYLAVQQTPSDESGSADTPPAPQPPAEPDAAAAMVAASPADEVEAEEEDAAAVMEVDADKAPAVDEQDDLGLPDVPIACGADPLDVLGRGSEQPGAAADAEQPKLQGTAAEAPADAAAAANTPPAAAAMDADETVDPAALAASLASPRPASAACAPPTPPLPPPGAVRATPLAALHHALPVRCVALCGSAADGWHVAVLSGGVAAGGAPPSATSARCIALWHLPAQPTAAAPGVCAGVLTCPAGEGGEVDSCDGGDDADASADVAAGRDAHAVALSPDGHTVYALGRLVPLELRRAAICSSGGAAARLHGGADVASATVVALEFGADGAAVARALLRSTGSLADTPPPASCVACFRAAPLAAAGAVGGGCARTLVVAAGRNGAATTWAAHGPHARARGIQGGTPLPVAQLRRASLTDIVALSPVRPAGCHVSTLLAGVCSSGAAALWDVSRQTLLCAWHSFEFALRGLHPLALPAAPDAPEGSLWALVAAEARPRRGVASAAGVPQPQPQQHGAALARLRAGTAARGAVAAVGPLIALPRPPTALASRGATAAAGLSGGGVILWDALTGAQTAALGRCAHAGTGADVTALAWAEGAAPAAAALPCAGDEMDAAAAAAADAKAAETRAAPQWWEGAALAVGDASGRVELYCLDA